MAMLPATTSFGAGDLQGIVWQLNLWTAQIELTLQELRGAQLEMSGRMQRLVESAEIQLMNVKVSFRNELYTAAAEKTESDERLKQELQHLTNRGASEIPWNRHSHLNHLVDAGCKQPDCSSACAANFSKCNGLKCSLHFVTERWAT